MKVLTDPVLIYASKIAYSSLEVLQFSYDMGLKYKDVPGVYVECGCAAGAQVIALAHSAPNKTIYAFDSFEGIPLPSNRDDQMPGIRFLSKEEQQSLPNPGEQVLESTGATSVSLDDFENHIKASGINMPERIFAVKGWFEEMIPKFLEAIGPAKQIGYDFPIAILRLDGDLYNSTYVCLKYLYPKVIEGGLVIIDDFALRGCNRAVFDYFNRQIPKNNKSIYSEGSHVLYWTK